MFRMGADLDQNFTDEASRLLEADSQLISGHVTSAGKKEQNHPVIKRVSGDQ